MPSGRRRTRYDIYADCVEVIARKGLCSLTRVSYGANLPVDRAKDVLSFLVSHGFVREISVSDRVKYRVAKWGLEFLETYRRMQKFFAALEEPITVRLPEVVLPGRVATGLKDLDSSLFGGIPENYAVVLTSPSCDQREALVKSFIEKGLRSGDTAFYFTIEAGWASTLAADFSNLFLFICNPQADRLVKASHNVFILKGVENLTDLSIILTSALRSIDGVKGNRRIAIGILSDILLQHQAVQTRRWLTGLITELKSKGFTVLAIMNPHMHSPQEVHAILGLFEGEISIYEKETMRGSEIFMKIRKMYNQRYMEDKIPLGKARSAA